MVAADRNSTLSCKSPPRPIRSARRLVALVLSAISVCCAFAFGTAGAIWAGQLGEYGGIQGQGVLIGLGAGVAGGLFLLAGLGIVALVHAISDTIVGICREKIANEQRRVDPLTADLTTACTLNWRRDNALAIAGAVGIGVMTAWITYYFVEAAWFAARPVRFGDATVAIDLTEDVYRPDAFRPRPRSLIVAAAAAAARARAFTHSPTPTPGDMSAELPPYEATSAASASDGHEFDFTLSTAGHGGGGRGGGSSWDDGHHTAHQHYNMFASGLSGQGRPVADRKVPPPSAQQQPPPVRSASERSDGSWLVVRNNV